MPKGITKYRKFHMASQPGLLFNADGDGGGGAPPAPAPPAPAPEPAPAPASPEDDGKGGKAAILADLATERDKRQAAEAELARLRQAGESDADRAKREGEQAIATAREEAAQAARAEVMSERVMDRIELAASGKFTDTTDATLHLKDRASEFIKDGALDTAAITAAVDKLLADKPHLAAKTPVPSPGRVGIGTGSSSASDAVQPGLGRLQHAYAQSPHNK